MKKRDENRSRMMKEEPHRFFRRGVPNGMRKHKAVKLWAKAHKLADRFIQIMKDKGELPDEVVEVIVADSEGEVSTVSAVVPVTDNGKAEAALREVAVLAFGPSTQAIKIQACNTLLAYTKSKPESKSKLTVNPLSFLDDLEDD